MVPTRSKFWLDAFVVIIKKKLISRNFSPSHPKAKVTELKVHQNTLSTNKKLQLREGPEREGPTNAKIEQNQYPNTHKIYSNLSLLCWRLPPLSSCHNPGKGFMSKGPRFCRGKHTSERQYVGHRIKRNYQ